MTACHRPAPASVLATLVLAGLAWLGNAAHAPLFFGVDLIFGPIFALVALAWIGPLAGLTVALAGGLYTLELWGHPYALLILLLEVAIVGWLLRRGWFLALGDALFWVVLGGPLALLLYAFPLGMDWGAATLIALKQPVNGLLNALLASLLILALQWRFRLRGPYLPEHIQLRHLLFGLFLATALLPGMFLMVLEGWEERGHRERALATRMALVAETAETAGARAPGNGRFLVLPAPMPADPRDHSGLPGGLGPAAWPRIPTTTPRLALTGAPQPELPAMKRWAQALYMGRFPHPTGGMVTVVTPASDLVADLRQQYRHRLLLLGFLGLTSALAAGLLSRWLTRPLHTLTDLSARIPDSIAAHQSPPAFPRSRIEDFQALMDSLERMTRALSESIRESESARAELDERVHQRTAELEYQNQQLQRLATVAAHHLQEPVRRANIAFQRIRRNPAAENEGWSHLDDNLGRLARLNSALHRYLAFLVRTPEPSTVDLGKLVARSRRAIEREHERPLHLTTRPESLPRVHADPEMLAEVFRQILANALQFSGDGAPVVHVEAESRDQGWVIRVTDEGPGIEPAYRERVFRLFEQLAPEGAGAGGTGLGLSLVARIIEAHGGSVLAEAGDNGRGTTITFTLPGAANRTNAPTLGNEVGATP